MIAEIEDSLVGKLGIGGASIAVRRTWKRLPKSRHRDPVLLVVERVLKVFQDHGVAIPEIPRLIPQIRLEQLQSLEALLPALTNDVIAKVVELFQIQRAWLDGTQDRMYELRWCGKAPLQFFRVLAALQPDNMIYPVIAFCCDSMLDMKRRNEQPIVIALAEKCADLDGKAIISFRTLNDRWRW